MLRKQQNTSSEQDETYFIADCTSLYIANVEKILSYSRYSALNRKWPSRCAIVRFEVETDILIRKIIKTNESYFVYGALY